MDERRQRDEVTARVRLSFDESTAVSGGGGGEVEGLMLRSAVLLTGETRTPIGPGGIAIARGTGGAAVAGGVGASVRVLETENGHALLHEDGDGVVMLNGDPVVQGERRPLKSGDAIAVGAAIHFYLAAGKPPSELPRVDTGVPRRLKSSHGTVTVGRSVDCDMVLDHPTVAMQHARITRHGNSANIDDVSGGLGVVVNGRRVSRARLVPGDSISVGPFRIIFDGVDLHRRQDEGGLPIAADSVWVEVPGGLILQPTSVALHPGELVAIIGESGAGKSTLLKALAGVDVPTGGGVLAGGEPVALRLPDIGYVPQFDVVHRDLTVREALGYAARLRLPADTSEAELDSLVASVIKQLGLEERAELFVGRLSGGQRKRVAVGTELIHRPGALFLDEPTTGLDPALERRMMMLFREIADGGRTVGLATHATASLRLCDRVIVMGRGGHLLFNGEPDGLLEAFRVETFDDLYVKLESFTHGARGPAPHSAPTGVPMTASTALRKEIQSSWLRQTGILSKRYATLVSRDRRFLRNAILQGPILGLMSALLFSSDVFRTKATAFGVPASPGKAAQLIFVMVTIVTWLGLINSAREVVKEKAVASREFAIGVKVPAYVASKLLVLFSLATFQSLLLTAVVFVVRAPHEGLGRLLWFTAALTAGSWLGVLMGLATSSFAKTEEQAVSAIPLLLVPQMLFAGAIVQLSAIPAALMPIAEITPTRWTFAQAGNAMEMTKRLAADPSPLTGLYGEFFDLGFLGYAGVWVLFAVVLLGVLGFRLATRTD